MAILWCCMGSTYFSGAYWLIPSTFRSFSSWKKETRPACASGTIFHPGQDRHTVMEHFIFCAGRADCSRSSSVFFADSGNGNWKSSSDPMLRIRSLAQARDRRKCPDQSQSPLRASLRTATTVAAFGRLVMIRIMLRRLQTRRLKSNLLDGL